MSMRMIIIVLEISVLCICSHAIGTEIPVKAVLDCISKATKLICVIERRRGEVGLTFNTNELPPHKILETITSRTGTSCFASGRMLLFRPISYSTDYPSNNPVDFSDVYPTGNALLTLVNSLTAEQMKFLSKRAVLPLNMLTNRQRNIIKKFFKEFAISSSGGMSISFKWRVHIYYEFDIDKSFQFFIELHRPWTQEGFVNLRVVLYNPHYLNASARVAHWKQEKLNLSQKCECEILHQVARVHLSRRVEGEVCSLQKLIQLARCKKVKIIFPNNWKFQDLYFSTSPAVLSPDELIASLETVTGLKAHRYGDVICFSPQRFSIQHLIYALGNEHAAFYERLLKASRNWIGDFYTLAMRSQFMHETLHFAELPIPLRCTLQQLLIDSCASLETPDIVFLREMEDSDAFQYHQFKIYVSLMLCLNSDNMSLFPLRAIHFSPFEAIGEQIY